ncbi:MAG: efflux RND transporter periplasmic adaptor subunit [Acidobacteriota bacterium]
MRSKVLTTAVFVSLSLLPAGAAMGSGAPGGAEAPIVVHERSFSTSLTAYALVEPVALVTVPALVDGTLVQWKVSPGMAVRRGELLGRLAGPERAKELAEARSALDQAESALDLAKRNEAVVHQTYPVISNSQKLAEAQAAVTQTASALKAAKARWTFVSAEGEIRAPVSGTVTEVAVAQGQPVAAGTVLARLEDPARLWARAVFYGRDALELKAGMKGLFTPAGGGEPVPVQVRGVIAPVRPDGGRAVGCVPIGPAAWISGQAGTLRLEGAAASWPAVPERALVLKGQQWYVLIAGPSGEERREVEPGPESDGWRAIVRGLKAGDRVVANDAYLRFHQDVAKSYTPPD